MLTDPSLNLTSDQIAVFTQKITEKRQRMVELQATAIPNLEAEIRKVARE